MDIQIEPYLEDQWHDFDIAYWEGAVRIKGSHPGKGYIELTGY